MPYLTGQVLSETDIANLFKSGTYTPTLVNLAIGTGGTPTNSAKWTFVGFPAGGVLTLEGMIKFGTTAPTLPGASEESISLPAGYSMIDTGGSVASLSGQVSFYDVSAAGVFQGFAIALSATTFGLRWAQVTGTIIQVNNSLTLTTPIAWAINDEIHYRISVRCTGT
jgi:hypothetical protein